LSFSLRLADRDAVFVRSILEAYDGLGSFHGDGSGIITITTPVGRAPELRQLLADLEREGVAMLKTPLESMSPRATDPAVF
jgi:hypothetical protein